MALKVLSARNCGKSYRIQTDTGGTWSLTVKCIMPLNGHTQFKNLAANAARFLKCVSPFSGIKSYKVSGTKTPEFGELCVSFMKSL